MAKDLTNDILQRGSNGIHVLRDKYNFQSMQLILFNYDGHGNDKIMLVLNEYPARNKIHALKITNLDLVGLRYLMSTITNLKLYRMYEQAYIYGVIGIIKKFYSYRLPLILPDRDGDEAFYKKYIKGSKFLTEDRIYRTYLLDKIRRPRLIIPNLSYYGLMDDGVEYNPETPLQEKADFIRKHSSELTRKEYLLVDTKYRVI